MTKESALLNASLIHSLMMNLGYFETVCFDTYFAGNVCLVYGHYNPSKVSVMELDCRLALHAVKGALWEDSHIEGSSTRVYRFTWHWDD